MQERQKKIEAEMERQRLARLQFVMSPVGGSRSASRRTSTSPSRGSRAGSPEATAPSQVPEPLSFTSRQHQRTSRLTHLRSPGAAATARQRSLSPLSSDEEELGMFTSYTAPDVRLIRRSFAQKKDLNESLMRGNFKTSTARQRMQKQNRRIRALHWLRLIAALKLSVASVEAARQQQHRVIKLRCAKVIELGELSAKVFCC